MATKPSGYQNRKTKAEREAAEQEARDAITAESVALSRSAYADIEPPPTDPVGLLVWAHIVAGRMAYVTLKDPDIGEPERRRVMSDFIGKIGLTAPKAILDGRLKDMERKLGMAQEAQDADTFDEQPTGQDRASDDGPEPLLADEPVADAEEDGLDPAPSGR